MPNEAETYTTSITNITFILFIKRNCIWGVCVHDCSNLWDAICGSSKTKGSKSMAATLGVSAGESLLFLANGKDKQKRFLPLLCWVSRCSKVRWMWSATVSKRIIRWNLWGDVSKPGQSAVWKNHYTEPDILDNFGGNRPLGMWHRSLRD